MATRFATVRWLVKGDIFLFYGSDGVFAPADEEAYFKALETTKFKGYLGGGGTDFSFPIKTRIRGQEVFRRLKVAFAAIHDGRAMRAVATAAAFMGMKIKVFSWKETQAAVEWLEVPQLQVSVVHAAFMALRDEVEALASKANP
jgi:hypothetical protein